MAVVAGRLIQLAFRVHVCKAASMAFSGHLWSCALINHALRKSTRKLKSESDWDRMAQADLFPRRIALIFFSAFLFVLNTPKAFIRLKYGEFELGSSILLGEERIEREHF
jgi:hypothetical protein